MQNPNHLIQWCGQLEDEEAKDKKTQHTEGLYEVVEGINLKAGKDDVLRLLREI